MENKEEEGTVSGTSSGECAITQYSKYSNIGVTEFKGKMVAKRCVEGRIQKPGHLAAGRDNIN